MCTHVANASVSKQIYCGPWEVTLMYSTFNDRQPGVKDKLQLYWEEQIRLIRLLDHLFAGVYMLITQSLLLL